MILSLKRLFGNESKSKIDEREREREGNVCRCVYEREREREREFIFEKSSHKSYRNIQAKHNSGKININRIKRRERERKQFVI